MTQRTPTTGKTSTTGSIGATATAGVGGASGKVTGIGAIANRTDAPRPTVPHMGGDAPPVRGTPSMVDVRGWDVVMTNGARLGTVERLIVDTAERVPRYLSVAPVGRNGSLLIPVGVGTLDEGQRQVVLHNLSAGTLEKLPLVTNGALTRELEREVFGAFTGRKASELAQPQWYADPPFDPTRLFGSAGTEHQVVGASPNPSCEAASSDAPRQCRGASCDPCTGVRAMRSFSVPSGLIGAASAALLGTMLQVHPAAV